jgi:hypothetical protein
MTDTISVGAVSNFSCLFLSEGKPARRPPLPVSLPSVSEPAAGALLAETCVLVVLHCRRHIMVPAPAELLRRIELSGQCQCSDEILDQAWMARRMGVTRAKAGNRVLVAPQCDVGLPEVVDQTGVLRLEAAGGLKCGKGIGIPFLNIGDNAQPRVGAPILRIQSEGSTKRFLGFF